MINKFELRLGNLVLRDGELFAVEIIHGSHLYKNWEPIPLTEEWLLRCGFVKGKDMFFLPIPILECEIHAVLFHGQYVIELHNHVKAIITEVKYLHQLQNLRCERGCRARPGGSRGACR